MSRVAETPFNTQIEGKITEIRDRTMSVQILSDGECFLVIPRNRVPAASLRDGALVKVFFTTKYGHIGVIPLDGAA